MLLDPLEVPGLNAGQAAALQRLRSREVAVVAAVESGEERAARRVGGVVELLGASARQRERLLATDVLARLERGASERHVGSDRRVEHDRVDRIVRDELLCVAVRARFSRARERLHAALVAVADGRKRQRRARANRLEVEPRDAADADHSDS